jgi:hypothetical protein
MARNTRPGARSPRLNKSFRVESLKTRFLGNILSVFSITVWSLALELSGNYVLPARFG